MRVFCACANYTISSRAWRHRSKLRHFVHGFLGLKSANIASDFHTGLIIWEFLLKTFTRGQFDPKTSFTLGHNTWYCWFLSDKMSDQENAAGGRGQEEPIRETVRPRDHGFMLADRFDNMAHSLDRLVHTLGRKKRQRRPLSSSPSSYGHL